MTDPEFHHEARAEFRDAALFYERQVAGLGFAFNAEVERAVRLIVDNPGIGSPAWRHYRQVLVRRFPYSVIYREREENPLIVAVAHQHRRPGYWRKRK